MHVEAMQRIQASGAKVMEIRYSDQGIHSTDLLTLGIEFRKAVMDR